MPAASGTSGRSTTGAFDFLDQIPSLTVAEKEVQQQPNPTVRASYLVLCHLITSPALHRPSRVAAHMRS